MLIQLANAASNVINPVLVILILSEPIQTGTPRERIARALPAYGRAVVSIGIAVLLAEAGKQYEIWPGHPYFPSGHTTFATAAALCLVLRGGPRWGYVAAPLVGLMGVSLVYGGWHTPIEVAAGLLLGTVVTVVAHCVTNRRK